jgi:hypothetical protein
MKLGRIVTFPIKVDIDKNKSLYVRLEGLLKSVSIYMAKRREKNQFSLGT